jgi:hypothetical protein
VSRKALSHAKKTLCVHADETEYASNDEKFPSNTNCADFSIGGGEQAGTGPFYPLALALDFFPEQGECHSSSMPGQWPSCSGGGYQMNIVADPVSGEVKVTTGLNDGSDAPPVEQDPQITALENKLKQQFAEAVLNAMDEQQKRKEVENDPIAKADAARKAYEERQSHIDYKAEHERNRRRIREVAQFTPDWRRSTEPLYIRGTVSRVDPPVGRQRWARLNFEESPDGSFVACVYAPIFDDLEQYVGQHFELRGMVVQGRCGGRVAEVQVNNPALVHDLAKGMPGDEAILPGMNASDDSIESAKDSVSNSPAAARTAPPSREAMGRSTEVARRPAPPQESVSTRPEITRSRETAANPTQQRDPRIDLVLNWLKSNATEERMIVLLRQRNEPIELTAADRAQLVDAGASDKLIQAITDPGSIPSALSREERAAAMRENIAKERERNLACRTQANQQYPHDSGARSRAFADCLRAQ